MLQNILSIILGNFIKIFLRFMTMCWFWQKVTNLLVKLATQWGRLNTFPTCPRKFRPTCPHAYFMSTRSKNKHENTHGPGIGHVACFRMYRIDDNPSIIPCRLCVVCYNGQTAKIIFYSNTQKLLLTVKFSHCLRLVGTLYSVRLTKHLIIR